MALTKSKIPGVSYDDMFGVNEGGGATGVLFVAPTKSDVIAVVDEKLSGHTPEFLLRCNRCHVSMRVYSDVDRPMTKVKCDCKSYLLREIEAMLPSTIQDSFVFKILVTGSGEKWPVKIDRLTAPSGMKYTGTRLCTKDEAVSYFVAALDESRKRGFRMKKGEER